MSHIEKQRQIFESNKNYILKLFNWREWNGKAYQSNGQYESLMYERGIEYLESSMYSWEAKMLAQDELFWKWWKNQWNLRDAALVREIPNMPHVYTVQMYMHHHSVDQMFQYPSASMMEESYAKMIGEFNDKHNQKKSHA